MGDAFREAGVLVAVFGLLDPLVFDRMTRAWGVYVTATAIVLLVAGMMLDSWWRQS